MAGKDQQEISLGKIASCCPEMIVNQKSVKTESPLIEKVTTATPGLPASDAGPALTLGVGLAYDMTLPTAAPPSGPAGCGGGRPAVAVTGAAC